MSTVKVSIVSLIALVVFMCVPNESLALSLKCPVNEYGMEECEKSSYTEESYKVEGYTQGQNTSENKFVDTTVADTSRPVSDNLPITLMALAIVGLVVWLVFRKRSKITHTTK